ncbi:MAG: phosphoglucosamine mutase [Clostridia bacterium]|nr:phosphoglucosamine mutase [Clostridia bacterium]
MKYFGTDGIRGKANVELDAALAYKTGVALGAVLEQELSRKPLVYIGRDTRLSGGMLEAALTAGLCAAGANVTSLGVLPTPAVAYLTGSTTDADAGIVISASHNPFDDNGIKIFGGAGYKLTDAQEEQIERYIDAPPAVQKTGAAMGAVLPFDGDPVETYVRHLADSAPCRLNGMRIAVDCANGAASTTAEKLFYALGADAYLINRTPDGVNINENCGSTHIRRLQEVVRGGGFAAGAAFDGDADRCLMVDETGEVIDGDHLIGILAARMQKTGKLKGGVVGTILTNLGLHAFLRENGIPILSTQVGDRYVLEKMREQGWNIGGEQSGHVILSDFATTGDGQLTAVQFLCALKSGGQTAGALNREIESFPQISVNVPVSNKLKARVAQLPAVRQVSEEIAAAFGGDGRVVIRPSGTEPKVRVMVEGRDPEAVKLQAERAAQAVREAVADMKE